ncbi:MAG: DMT family transporter [Myxococcota bacterium]|nr:DMT family transporter [Myxococcota bacterium]
MELHQPSGERALGLALASTTMLLWGVLPYGLELALAELDAVTITWFRFGFSAVALGLWLGLRGGLPERSALGRGGSILLAISTAGLAVNYLTYLIGLDLTSPATAQVLIQAAPPLLAVGGIVVFREQFTPGQWLGFGVMLCGLGLFFASQVRSLVSELSQYLDGVAAMGVAAVTWAFYGLAQKQLLQRLSSQQIMWCIYTGCFVAFSFGASPSQLAGLSAVGWGGLLFASANTLVAYGAFAAALAHWQASRVSAVLALTPLATLATGAVGAALFPALVARDPVSLVSLLGAFVVVAGSCTVALLGRSGSS